MKLHTIRLTVIGTVAAVIRRLTSTQYAEQPAEIIDINIDAPSVPAAPRAAVARAGVTRSNCPYDKSIPESALPRAKDNAKLLDVRAGLKLIGCNDADDLWNYRFPAGSAAARLKQVIGWERTGGPSGGCSTARAARQGQRQLPLAANALGDAGLTGDARISGEGERRERGDGAVRILEPIPDSGNGQMAPKPDSTVRVLSAPASEGPATLGGIAGLPAGNVPNTELVRKGKKGRILIQESLAKLGIHDAKTLWMTKWPTDSAAHALRMAIMAGLRFGDPAVEGLGISQAFIDEHQTKRRTTAAAAAAA